MSVVFRYRDGRDLYRHQWVVKGVKSNSMDDGANSARNEEHGVLAATAEVDRGEESRGG